MKLTIKTLKAEKFQVEVDDTALVKDAKQVIAAAKKFSSGRNEVDSFWKDPR